MSPGALLDTDWVIDHFNGIAAITRRIEELRPLGLALSVISLAELYEGVHPSPAVVMGHAPGAFARTPGHPSRYFISSAAETSSARAMALMVLSGVLLAGLHAGDEHAGQASLVRDVLLAHPLGLPQPPDACAHLLRGGTHGIRSYTSRSTACSLSRLRIAGIGPSRVTIVAEQAESRHRSAAPDPVAGGQPEDARLIRRVPGPTARRSTS